jgi:hypothetical protein
MLMATCNPLPAALQKLIESFQELKMLSRSSAINSLNLNKARRSVLFVGAAVIVLVGRKHKQSKLIEERIMR